MKAWNGGVVGTSDARPGPCGDRTCETDLHVRGLATRMCISATAYVVVHLTVAPRPPGGLCRAGSGGRGRSTHLFRCLLWHLRRLGCALHPNLRGGSLRASNPMREGHGSAATDAS